MSLVKKNKENSDTRLTVVGAMGGNFIFKPPSDRFPEMPQNEHLTMRMAETFGIRVVPSSLIRLLSGELSYITKRVDRTETGEKIHMIDMFQITEAFDKYKGSMEKVGKALDSYSSNTFLDKTYYFDLAAHLKTFSGKPMTAKIQTAKHNMDDLTKQELGRLFPKVIVPPNDNWADLYEQEKKIIIETLGGHIALKVEHFGISAVPNLAAKPTIDIHRHFWKGPSW